MRKKILFVCSGNTCRSAMARGIFLKYMSSNNEDYEVLSAGMYTLDGLPASQEALKVLLSEGIDISSHKSQQVNKDLVWQSDLILTMTQAHCRQLCERFPEKKDKIFSIGEFIGESSKDIQDPYGGGEEAYIESSQQLKIVLKQVMVRISRGYNKKQYK